MGNTAITCAVAFGAMIAGPGVAGTAVASADLFGFDGDILDVFDQKEKKKSDLGAKIAAQQNGGTDKAGGPGPEAVVGARRSEAVQSSGPANRVSGNVIESATAGGARQSLPAAESGGGGGGGVPASSNVGRAPKLAPVPTAPSSRAIVIRSAPPAAPAPTAPVAPAPVTIPPIAAAPLPALPPGGVPVAPGAPIPGAPAVTPLIAGPPPDALPVGSRPESFRFGYSDYLRSAGTSDLFFAVLPGIAGIALLTAAGGVMGLRQARAAQGLPSPHIARFLP